MKRAQPKKKQKAIPAIHANRRKEWRLDLPLSAVIEGRLPHGAKFSEATIIKNISATGAYFCLDSGVVVGSRLNLMIELPKNLTGGKEVKLNLGGITVRLEEPDKKGKRQGVAIHFSKDFKFVAAGKKKKKAK